ncbi:hypothetical protein BDP27DRAFT_1426450 [Rhodocollybia butyracea]|uniref:Uncharacterized protein n=1 Tax=Rhodocollybia butyracea TaxID=206335 RepID=A0A9P5PIA6_9AGAR|nr:hypothetical protein BDP27DRAFT_1426450 [Rhodocollybia butyracea]
MQVGRGRTFARSHNISTLDPARLVPTDFIDLKQQFHFAVRYRNICVISGAYKRIIVKEKNYGHVLTFPAGSHGYFYLHHPPADAHPCAATLRFRICDKLLPPQEGFSSGKDLLLPKGAPWEMNLLHLFTSAFVTNFREALLLDNMVSEEALSQLDGLLAGHQRGSWVRSPLLFSFRQPFSVSMGQRSTALSIVDLHASTISLAQVVTTIAKRKDKTLSCTMCLEYNPSARRRIVVRVLQIPKEFHGETFVNEGDILPLKIEGKSAPSSMADVLIRQSPSVPSHADQSQHST